MSEKTITILCSGIGLGLYIPGLILNYQFQTKGLPTDVVVFESLILSEKRKKIPETKVAFQQSFAVALMGQRLARDITPSLDKSLVSDLLATWRKERRKRFIVFSGFWLPILEQYLSENNFQNPLIHLCHIGASVNVSWKLHKIDHPCCCHIWFSNWEEKSISYYIQVSKDKPVPFYERTDRFVIHGGGWGIGTFKDKIPQLEEMGLKLDVIVNEKRDSENRKEGNRYFMINPRWNPWEKDEEGYHQFPPFGEVRDNKKIKFRNNRCFPEVYHLIRQNQAIISKSGGATLIDSLSSATPIVLLEPYGEYEKKNALLWEYLGFGIPYQKWIDSSCSLEILERLHTNLLKARLQTRNYVEEFILCNLKLQ